MVNPKNNFAFSKKVYLVVAAAAILFLLWKTYYLQFIRGEDYRRISRANVLRSIPSEAPRGIIYDRFGKVLVSNRPIFSVYILRGSLKDEEQTLLRLSRILLTSPAEIKSKIHRHRGSLFEPILIAFDIDIKQAARIEEEIHRMPGVVINTFPARSYPAGSSAAHVLGYVGEITAQELNRLSAQGYRMGDLIGKTGVEKVYDNYLRGREGEEQFLVNVRQQVVGELSHIPTIPGNNLILTLDLELQKAAERFLAGRAGAVVVLNPKNGEVMALSSSPSFNPARLTPPVDPKVLKGYQTASHPFVNRVLSAYPPGSTFKAVTFVAALKEKVAGILDRFYCDGIFEIGDRRAFCWKKEGHKAINFFDGLVWSCDSVFYKMGLELGPEILHDWALTFGLGKVSGIDLPGEHAGTIPDGLWKEEHMGIKWFPGDSINYGIGQGFLQVTPLQLALLYGLIANQGVNYVPHVLQEIKDVEGNVLYSAQTKELNRLNLGEELDKLRNALRAVVSRGTARRLDMPDFPTAGKTGTAEDPPRAPHAWYVGYGPVDDPQIVVCVFVEQGGAGDKVAVPIAKEIFEWYRDNRYKSKFQNLPAGQAGPKSKTNPNLPQRHEDTKKH